jgi:hypothetical protein
MPTDIAITRPTLTRTARLAEAALEQLGFQLLAVEIDVDAKRARVEVKRHDGYSLTLDVRDGSGSITREWVRERAEMVGRRGDRFRARTLRTEFLGRTRVHDGARSALRVFANLIGDNAANQSRIDARAAIAFLLH